MTDQPQTTEAVLTEVDSFEIWLTLNLMENCHPDDKEKLARKANDLVYRLRREGKLAGVANA